MGGMTGSESIRNSDAETEWWWWDDTDGDFASSHTQGRSKILLESALE